jgi:glycosyltransferase involved in cell wall biosynthesis
MRVRFCSPIRSRMGYAELGRILINQLVRAGHQVTVKELDIGSTPGDYGPLGAQAERLLGDDPGAQVNIVNMLPLMYAEHRLPGAINIGYSMWEADRLPDDWVTACNAMDAIWLPSQWSVGLYRDSGVTVPLHVVGVDAAPTPVGVPVEGPMRLLSVFQWSARKNPAGLLRAYCAAFDGDEGVTLTLKVHRQADPIASRQFVTHAISQLASRVRPRKALPRIEIATDVFSEEEMRQLHAGCHAYVSLSHGEGWGLGAWEATLAGKPVIHTGWSSPVEFVHPQGLVASSTSPTYGMQDFVPFYDQSMNWGEPHLDDAIAKLRDLRTNYDRWLRTSREHRNVINNRYSLDRRIEQLQAALRSSLP